MNFTLAIYFISMLVALIFAVMWLRGQFSNKPNKHWKAMMLSMVVIFFSGMALSYQRNQQYLIKQARLARIAKRKARIERRDLLQLDITSKSAYDDALVLVMQPNRHHGVIDKLNGSELDQVALLRNAQQAMYRERKDSNAKNGGIIIVSYNKVGKKFKPTMVLYASKRAIKHIGREKHLGTTKFLTGDLSGYYFNKKFVTDSDGKAHGMLADISLSDTKHFKKVIKKRIVNGKTVFVHEPKHKHKHRKAEHKKSDDDSSK